MKEINKLLLLLLFLNGVTPFFLRCLAQESDSTEVLKQSSDTTYLPSRGNHVFTSISNVDDPFISTKFHLGFGVAEMIETEIPITIGEINKTIKFEPDIFYSTGGVEFQYAIRNWAAVNIKAFGLARLGNNFLSFASEGVSAASSFNIGWLFRIAENEDLMFSASISLNTTDLTFIDIFGGADTTITQIDTIINKQIVTDYQSLTTQTDLRFAVRFSDVFGLVTKLSGGFGEFYAAENQSQFQYNFGLALSIDLRNWIHIPFGIGLGGTLISNDWRFNDAKPPVFSGNINIAFYNRNDFTLGIENFLQLIEPQKYEQTFKFIYSRIYISYYF
ncbi:MAG: hypothetical protein M5T52_00450 [Ignavibacteriaceae bacterium]|nr:hypothetical protein [Ignavibacteriaceae bacterium]MEB2296475.1 hypothetical protein [Ignavibacteria bacterium]